TFFEGFSRKARFITLFGEPHGKGYEWLPRRSGGDKKISDGITQYLGGIENLARMLPTTGKPLVVGFSNGGRVVLEMVLLRPEALDAVFLVGSGLPKDLIAQHHPGPAGL